jgi:PAS domain S-box-containing protein
MKKILLIDDDQDTHVLMRMILQSAGYSLISAYDGADGLVKSKETNPDFIILDYLMPEKDGLETLNEIKNNPDYEQMRNIPIIMLTAVNQSPKTREQLLGAGLHACLEKPFGSKELLNIIDNTFVANKIRIRNERLQFLIESSRNFMENLLESCPVAIFTTDNLGRITYASRAVNTIFGLKVADILEQNLFEVLKLKRNIVVGFKQDSAVSYFEETAKTNTGKNVVMGFTVSALFDCEENQIGYLVVGQDLSDQKRLERELLEKERLTAITESLATINHQINNPLTPILGNVQLLLKDTSRWDAGIVKKLEVIKSNAAKISEIIKKFNQLSEPIRKKYYDDINMLDI